MLENFLDFVYDIFIEIIVPLVLFLYILFSKKLKNFWFKRIFGKDAGKKEIFTIAYAGFELRYCIINQTFHKANYPYFKPRRGSKTIDEYFSIENSVSNCELRAAKYLVSAFISAYACQPNLTSDLDIESSANALDTSFLSLGALSNYKTVDILQDTSNNLVEMTTDCFYQINTKNPILKLEQGYDYGLILKIRPKDYPHRVWVTCAGLGEWGTSGAAYYLANNWRNIINKTSAWWNPLCFGKGRNFAVIVRVVPEKDDSAKLIAVFKNSRSVKKAVKKLAKKKNGVTQPVHSPPPSGTGEPSLSATLPSDSSAVTTVAGTKNKTTFTA